jgi:rubrerythrin
MAKPLKIVSVYGKVLTYVYEGKTRIRSITEKQVKKFLLALKWRRAWRCPHCFLRQSPLISGCGCSGDAHPPLHCVGCGRPTDKPVNS